MIAPYMKNDLKTRATVVIEAIRGELRKRGHEAKIDKNRFYVDGIHVGLSFKESYTHWPERAERTGKLSLSYYKPEWSHGFASCKARPEPKAGYTSRKEAICDDLLLFVAAAKKRNAAKDRGRENVEMVRAGVQNWPADLHVRAPLRRDGEMVVVQYRREMTPARAARVCQAIADALKDPA